MLPAPVDRRHEFVSAGWIESARTFLTQFVSQHPQLSGENYSMCEAFDAAPPSFEASNRRAAWYWRLLNGALEVGAGEIPDAQLDIRGDYQHVLSMAQSVNAAGEEAMKRARREFRHRAGRDALRITGTMPTAPALLQMINDLHDHMATLTIENPHYEHRVERLGLARHLVELRERGYTVIERAVTESFADELRERVADEVRKHHPLTTNGLMMRHRMFEEVALNPLVCTVAESAVGRGMVLGAMSGTYKETGPGAIDIHADYPLVREPYPEFGLICVACWALEDWTVAAGPTWVIPGSHLRRRGPKRGDSRDGAVPIEMPKGSVALWANGVWHWQGDRAAPGARVAIHVTYNRVFVRQLDDFRAVDEAMYARNPPAFSTLMGQDDPFGKSSYRGHDGKRFAYAARTMNT
jgi:ectoine hydroxylase-related dioxygenase (phytanoyl-CoA dioxygenase family)